MDRTSRGPNIYKIKKRWTHDPVNFGFLLAGGPTIFLVFNSEKSYCNILVKESHDFKYDSFIVRPFLLESPMYI